MVEIISSRFFKKFYDQELIVNGEPSLGQPTLYSACALNGDVPVIIKHWPEFSNDENIDIKDIWLHEIRQLQRLKGSAGVFDYITPIFDFGQDDTGLFLVLNSHDRFPLTFVLQTNTSGTVLSRQKHWLKKLSISKCRVTFWRNIIRLIKALDLLHSRGWLHRRIGLPSILTSMENSEIVDFQLTGFEWSLLLPTLSSPIIIKEIVEGDLDEQEASPITFDQDWYDLGCTICQLLKINVEHLIVQGLHPDLFTNGSKILLSEITLLQSLLGIVPFAPNTLRNINTKQQLLSAIENIIVEIQNQFQPEEEKYNFACDLTRSAHTRNNLVRAIEVLCQNNHLSGNVDLTDASLIEFIKHDLSDEPALLLCPLRKDATTDETPNFLLKGRRLIYLVEPCQINIRYPDKTWQIGWCRKAYTEPAYWMKKSDKAIHLQSNQLTIFTSDQARLLYRQQSQSIHKTEWTNFLSRLADEMRNIKQNHQALLEGFAVHHLTEIAFAKAEMFPVELVDTQFHQEEGKWRLALKSHKNEDAEIISKSLRISPPAKRLIETLHENDIEEINLTWILTNTATFAKEDDSTFQLTFEKIQKTESDEDILIFTCLDFTSTRKTFFITPASLQGTLRQLERHALALDHLSQHEELMDVLLNPHDHASKAETYISDNEIPSGMDYSKGKTYKNIIETLPLSLVQGPPGVGKTYLICKLAEYIFDKQPESKVIFTAQSHSTVQQLYKKIRGSVLGKGDSLIIQCSKQHNDSGSVEESDESDFALPYIQDLMNSPLYARCSSKDLKAQLLEMSTGEISNRYLLINQLIRSANLVFATTNSPQVARLIDSQSHFDWSIMEETGKVTGIELLSPLLLSHRRLLIGDHQQLPPYRSNMLIQIMNDKDAVQSAINEVSLVNNSKLKGEFVKQLLQIDYAEALDEEQSIHIGASASRSFMLFESLIQEEEKRKVYHAQKYGVYQPAIHIASMLTIQRRMHPDIACLISEVFYQGKLNTDKEREEHYNAIPSKAPFNFDNPSVLKESAALVWIDMPDVQTTMNLESPEKYPKWHNPSEIAAILSILFRIKDNPHRDKSESPSIAILSPFNEQVIQINKQIRHYMQQGRLLAPLKKLLPQNPLRISTIDSFQGDEADFVIISLVRNNGIPNIYSSLGILLDGRRINVMLSRAKYKLIIVGSFTLLNEWANKINREIQKTGVDTYSQSFLVKLMCELKKLESNNKVTRIPYESILHPEFVPTSQVYVKSHRGRTSE